ncbi:MAG: GAF domain-containing protein [Chloroflexi bacterium]|nr:GAF domain-containing protein [Chloroflexota bacterium]MCL5074111.1 GAF domain-containing protein [Chloroflexota bacterium]
MGEKTKSHYQALYEVAKNVNSTLDLREVLQSTVESAAKAMGAKGCALMLLDATKERLLPSVTYGLSERYLQKGPIETAKSLAEALEGRPITITDATSDPRIQYPDEARAEGIASILGVPVRLRGEIIGVIRLYTAEPREFSAEDANFLEAIASLGAIALENARLYQEIKTDYKALQKDLQEWYAAWGIERTAEAITIPAAEPERPVW